MSTPVSVALTWLNFPLSVLLALQESVASVTNVYYDMDINILKALFLENDGSDYFNYASNRIFQTLDVAKFTTSATPPVLMQDSALAYVAEESNLVLANVSNQSAWLTAFRAAMETQLTALDATAMEYAMGSGPTFTPLDPGITLSRNASTDEVQIGSATFTSLPFVVGDIVYFDVACTFANSITKTYRVNLRARAPNVQVYPMRYLPPPPVYAVNVYVLKPESVPTTSTWTINSTPYTFPFQLVGLLNGVNILLRHGFYIIFSSNSLTIGDDVPAGVYTSGDATIFNWLVQESSEVFDAVPTLTADILLNNEYQIDFALSDVAQLTTQGKLFFSAPATFTAVDDRIHDSGTFYDTMGFTRQQPYPSQTLAYFQCVQPELAEPVEGYYFIIPSDTTGLTVIIGQNMQVTTYDYALIEAGTYSFLGKSGNKVFIISVAGIVGINVSDGSPLNPCVIYPGIYVAVAPLPVTETSYDNDYSNSGFLQTVPPLFSDLAPTFQLTAERIQAGINTFGSPYVCRRINVTNDDITYEFLQIENQTKFTVGEWPDAGFHEERVSTQLTVDLQVRLVLNSNGGQPGTVSQLYNIGNTVSSLDSSQFSRGDDIFERFNTEYDGSGEDFASFAITENTVIYAIWTTTSAETFNITYFGLDYGTNDGSPPVDSTQYLLGETATILSNGGMTNADRGPFLGWSIDSDPNSFTVTYTADQEITVSQNLALYAVFAETFTITYYGLAYSGTNVGSPPVDSTQYLLGDNATILGNGGLTNSLRTGPFLGWSTDSDPQSFTVTYTADQEITISQSLILYAVFTESFNITYYGSLYGTTIGSPPVDSTSYLLGETATILSNGGMTNSLRTGPFLGWSTESDTPFTVTYTADQEITISQSLVLYAVFAEN